MGYIIESLRILIGMKPHKPAPEELAPEVKEIYVEKRKDRLTKAKLLEMRHEHRSTCCNKWQRRRWATLIAVNLLFVASYYFDVQVLEGALTASRFVGFHMADLNAALQVMLAFKDVVTKSQVNSLGTLPQVTAAGDTIGETAQKLSTESYPFPKTVDWLSDIYLHEEGPEDP